MSGKRRPHGALVQSNLCLLQFDTRGVQRGAGLVDLAGRNRARILDPAVTGQQLLGLLHRHPGQVDGELFLAIVQPQEDGTRFDMTAGNKGTSVTMPPASG